MSGDSPIRNFFKNQTIFITGGSGFIGRLLIEKLLRECFDLRQICILIRPKKGKSIQQRAEEFFNVPCYDLLKNKNPNFKENVRFINGDCLKPSLGLSNEDLEFLQNEATCVLHSAADVRFDQNLKQATCNVKSTLDLLNIAKKMKNLKVFIYISTAYSNCLHSHIKEEVYEPPIAPESLFVLLETIDESNLDVLTSKLVGNWPNTYIYTKSISESLVGKAAKDFPTVVFRPSIVSSSLKEPMPGWIDNTNGIMGVYLGIGMGIVRTFHAKDGMSANTVPVDYVCNSILASAWMAELEKNQTVKVYNYSGTKIKQLTAEKLYQIGKTHYWNFGFDTSYWYPVYVICNNKISYKISTLLLHKLPAFVVDFVCFWLGKKVCALETYAKIDLILEKVGYFTQHSWTWDEDNVTDLWNRMTEEDKRNFNFHLDEEFNWNEYLHHCALGLRKYILKEKPQNERVGKMKFRVLGLFVLHYLLVLFLMYLLYKFVGFVLNYE